MISNNYKMQLAKEAKQLDTSLGQDTKFENLVREITQESGARASLELINELGILVKKSAFPKIKERQEKIIELLYKYLGSKDIDEFYQNLKDVSSAPFEELQKELYELVGLDNVKQQVRNLIAFNRIQRLRVDSGLKKSDKTLHMAFLGNPGTGKTSVARIIGKMYKSIGLLSKGHFIEASRTDLIAEYQGQTAIKVKRLINRAKGGVLFIDEAYSITENDHSDSYGRECLTELTKALEDYRNDLLVIVAGYTELMEQFFNSNPGLKSRFNTFIPFDDYSLEELDDIFLYLCKTNEYEADDKTLGKVRSWLQAKLNQKDENFSNGRLVRNLFDDIIMNQSIRLSEQDGNISNEMLKALEESDVPRTE
ncbi:AAA family ATPase [Sedimentibacter saalensis]|jgi:SpoVK/Ycf46/Vps4 family AAA+-type ATPase|uniref:AAA family ATPase n=1 Tax=Sedimentibacter saalensis TaxID=130788 RepID=UPI003969DD4D